MIAYPFMLIEPAAEAGIKVPPDIEKYVPADYPHWHVYVSLQVGSSMPSADSHWTNAKVVAAISAEDIRTITAEQLLARGFAIGEK